MRTFTPSAPFARPSLPPSPISHRYSTLGSAYKARARYIDREEYTNLSDLDGDLATYAIATARGGSTAAKYFFANLTTDGKTPASAEARAIIEGVGGQPDIFGASYGLPAGSEGAGAYGNARPFQTQPEFVRIVGRDYFGEPADNIVYNRGPMMDLTNNPSFPSGHTTYGYTGALLLAMMVPERYPELIVRAAEYGNHRVVVGAHYVMDVIAGRTLALYVMAHLLANDPVFVGQSYPNAPKITDFRDMVFQARAKVRETLERTCAAPIARCAREDLGRFNDPALNEAFHASTLDYGLPIVHKESAGKLEDVGELAPEAGYLLTVAFPELSLQEAKEILTLTQGPGGGFLNDGSAFGVYSRLDLYAASKYAARVSAERGRVAAGRP